MATSQHKKDEHTTDNTNDTIAAKLKDCKIVDPAPKRKKQETGVEPQPECSAPQEELLEVSVALNPSNSSELIVELNGLDPFEVDFEDSSESDYDSDMEIDIIIQLKITLRDIEPPIWRCIQVSSSDTFEDLHYYIQEAMGWRNCHSHSFIQEDTKLVSALAYDLYKQMGSIDVVKEEHVCLRELFRNIGDKVLYRYDHGDSWEHEIVFEKFVLFPGCPSITLPRCVGGERACPPEDCGGVLGYKHLLEVKKDPEHEEYEDMIQDWLEKSYPGYDPEVFDPTKVFTHV